MTDAKLGFVLAQLHPVCHSPLQTLIDRARHELGLSLLPFDAYRAPAAQEAAFAAGASMKRAGSSWHNLTYPDGKPAAMAVHVRVELPGGGAIGFGESKLEYPGARKVYIDLYEDKVVRWFTARQVILTAVALLTEEVGWVAGARWKRLQDWCHVEWHPDGAPLEQVKAALAANELLKGGIRA